MQKKLLNDSLNKEIHTYACDISKKNEVKNTIDKISKEIGFINLAILNAAAYSPNKTQQFLIENYENLIDVNIKRTLYCIEILIEKMRDKHQGHITITSSPMGYRDLPTAGAYGLTKAALNNLAESLFFDLKKDKIKISVINLGFIKSESTNLNNFPIPFFKIC